jgi:N-acetylmuramidase
MKFAGQGQPLSRTGLNTALDILGLTPNDAAYIWAVIEVETAGVTQGFGFRADRRPQILFERHVFRKYTNRLFDAQAPDISGPAGGYGILSAQYGKLEKAASLCKRAKLGIEPVLKSASWGVGQIMGFNYQAAGHASATRMVQAMRKSEDAQLIAMARFLSNHGLTKFLLTGDWTGFARRYNGPSYWQNRYDVKLAAQYDRFASGSLPDLEMRAAQAALLFLGHSPGKIDGMVGPRTRASIRSFRIEAKLPPGDNLDDQTYQCLCEKSGIRPPSDR